jgi:hypothetical protein
MDVTVLPQGYFLDDQSLAASLALEVNDGPSGFLADARHTAHCTVARRAIFRFLIF